MNAAVWFNGEFVGDGGSFDEPVARNWNRPLMFGLPASMWRAGENTLLVRLRTYPGFGHLMPVAVGPTDALEVDFERRHFAQVTMSQIAAAITLLALLTGAMLWLIDRRDAAMPWFIGFCLIWFVYGANTFVRDIPVSAKVWWWALHSAVDLCWWLAVGLFHRLLGAHRPRVERTLLAWALLCSALYAVWDLPTLARFNPLLHALSAVAGVYLMLWLLRQSWRRPGVETALFALIFVVIFAGGMHDQLLNALVLPELWRSRYYLLHLVMPAMFVGLIALPALRSARGVQAVRDARDDLERRVAATTREIAGAYERERALLAERSAAVERERIYRDLHDSLGARLLSLVYGAGDERQAALARDALAEMRTLIATGEVAAAPLAELGADWQVETELRCEAAGLRLDWSVDGDAALSGRQRYQCERMLRELVSNAIEHAHGRTLAVAWRVDSGELRLDVGDDGRGLDAAAARDGHGLDSVRHRAADLGGEATWSALPGGGTRCTVRFRVGGAGTAAA